jgi:uncharacterized protein GlcG (DUF336 family)
VGRDRFEHTVQIFDGRALRTSYEATAMKPQRQAIRLVVVIAAFLSLASFAGSQVTEKKTLTLQGAERVIAAAKAEAQRLQAPGGAVAVVDDGGNLMALERLDGTFSAGANISIGKAKTAVMFKKPTRFFEELINSSGKGRTVMTALENFTPLIGGIPITVDGQIVGGVGVSGAATADQDEQLAIAGSKAFDAQAISADPSPAVSYWGKSQVDEAFSKGAVLFDGSDGRNYMVHASRREKPGQAEIHTKDADVIYVLQGRRLSSLAAKPSKQRTLALTNCAAAVSRVVRVGKSQRETSSSCLMVSRTSSSKSRIRSSITW